MVFYALAIINYCNNNINLYNFVNGEDDNMIFYILTKNSQMEAYTLQCVSEPLDEDLAKELRGEIVESQESQ